MSVRFIKESFRGKINRISSIVFFRSRLSILDASCRPIEYDFLKMGEALLLAVLIGRPDQTNLARLLI